MAVKRPIIVFLSVIFLVGCNADSLGGSGSRGEEAWIVQPFYGEIQLEVLDEATNAPIPNAAIQVTDLNIQELQENDFVTADENGRLTLHQLERGITTVGDDPPPPTFIFDAPGYATREYSVEQLAETSGANPYNAAGLPTTAFTLESGSSTELPVYEFTVYLSCAERICAPETPTATAVLPTEAPIAAPTNAPEPSPSPTPEPTLPPTAAVEPTPTALALSGPDFAYGNVSFTLDPSIATTAYPHLSNEGKTVTFYLDEDRGEGLISVTLVNLDEWWQTFVIPDLEAAIAAQDATYEFIRPGAVLFLQARLAFVSSPEVEGIRAVTMRGQALFIAYNGAIVYQYHGLTPDGRYFVEAFIPLSVPFLPETGDLTQETLPYYAVPIPEYTSDTAEMALRIRDYNDQVAEVLDGTADNVFTPDLTLIDQSILSVAVSIEP